MESEKQETPQEQPKEAPIEANDVDKVKEAREKLKAENDAFEAEKLRAERLRAERMIGGTTQVMQRVEKTDDQIEDEKAKEWADQIMGKRR